MIGVSKRAAAAGIVEEIDGRSTLRQLEAARLFPLLLLPSLPLLL